MATLVDKHRTDLLNRLKLAEGQLRGIQRMIESGEPCMQIATQMAAVRKALESTYVRMTVCYMEQQLQACHGADRENHPEDMKTVLEDVESLLGKLR